jgi:hypothetical protein
MLCVCLLALRSATSAAVVRSQADSIASLLCCLFGMQVEDKSPFELAPLSLAATGHAAYACGGFLLHGALHGAGIATVRRLFYTCKLCTAVSAVTAAAAQAVIVA